MFPRLARPSQLVYAARDLFSVSRYAPRDAKVTVLGAAGGVGQPLCLLLKKMPVVSHLNLYDTRSTKGVAADLLGIDYPAIVTSFPPSQLKQSLEGAHVILLVAGVPKRQKMKLDVDFFKKNASIVQDLTDAVAEVCPQAMLCIITDPINSTVPIASEVLKKRGVYDRQRVFGITTLDVVRSNTFIAAAQELANEEGVDVARMNVPVVGGHSSTTMIPLFSQSTPPITFPPEYCSKLKTTIQNAGKVILQAKEGEGTATLSMAYAAAEFCKSLLEALNGKEGKVQCAYVRSDETEAQYFASPVLLGKGGIEKNLGMGKLEEIEMSMLKAALPLLIDDIKKGEQFVKKTYSK